MKPHLVIDDAIPFLEGRLEQEFRCTVMSGAAIAPWNLADADGLLVRTRTRCDAPLLIGTPVRFIATGTIGLDHINTAYCDKAGITWQNAPGCNAPAVAQYVFRALSELAFPLSGIRDGEAPVLGVIGKGNVGSIVVDWGRRLGLRVIVSDPPRQQAGLTDEDYLPLEEVVRQADAVTVHTPLIKNRIGETLPPTAGLLSRPVLELLKPGAILINAARGGIVDETALRELKAAKGLKVCLDTWEGEPAISGESLAMADIATFHIAGYSRQGKERATYAILSGLEKFFGVHLPKEGLTGPYTPPDGLTEAKIRQSYDIMADDTRMRREYSGAPDFERLRDTYPLREEVGC